MNYNNDSDSVIKNPIKRLQQVLQLEKTEISSVYYFAIMSGLVQLIVPVGIQSIINFSMAGTPSTSLVILIIVVLVGVFLVGLLQIGQMRIIEKIEQRIFTRYAFEFAWRIPKIDLKSTEGYYLPEVVNKFFDTISFQKSLSKLLLDIPAAIIQILFGMVLLSIYSSYFVFFCLIIIVVVYLILKTTSKKGLKISLEESEHKYELAGWLEETARVFKSFHYSKKSTLPIDKTDVIVSKYLDARTRHFKVLLSQYWSLVIFKILITASTLIAGSILLIHNKINVGQFVAAEIIILSVMSAVEKLIQSLDKIYDLLTSIEKLGKVIDKPLEQNGKYKLESNSKGLSIEASNLSFGYNEEKMILTNLNFKILSGEKVCIMGSEGSGKSTLLKLITGSYLNYKGNLKINNLSIDNINLDSLRSEIGILFNQLEIFNGTLYENITLGNKEIKIEEIIELSNIIGLNDYINSLKHGFETILEPTGKKLSAGILKKILLLRALVGKPKLLLLEEPWADLDLESQKQIKNLILSNYNHATYVIITNDEDFASKCDSKFLFENSSVQIFKTN